MVDKSLTGMPRHFSRRMGRSSGMAPVTRSYKKVLNFLESGYAAGFREHLLVSGVDNATSGQGSNVDAAVPTGCIVKFIEVQFSVTNVTASNLYVNTTFGYRLSGQVAIDPKAVGGNPQRNQILHQSQTGIGTNQNYTRTFKFKIPKKFQRLREGMKWDFTWANNESANVQIQVIYKFYQ